jgi:transposase-like protein
MNSLENAIRLALEIGVTPALINICEWAKTYGVSTEQFMAEWDRQLSERSLKPSNSFEDGK